MKGAAADLTATFLGVGRLPGPTGTWGSLVVALPALLGSIEHPELPWFYAGALVLFVIAGLASIPAVQEVWGKDHSRIVIDEAAGMALVLSVPLSASSPTWLMAAFLLFRMYDIAKPFPANWLDRRGEGWAVMADDLVAAGYTIATLYLWQFAMHAIGPALLS